MKRSRSIATAALLAIGVIALPLVWHFGVRYRRCRVGPAGTVGRGGHADPGGAGSPVGDASRSAMSTASYVGVFWYVARYDAVLAPR